MEKKKAISLAISTVLAGSLLLGAASVTAYEAGDFIVRAGAANVDPNDDSDALELNGAPLAGTEAEVDDDTQLGLTFTYMLTDHIGVGLLAATPFEHDLKADMGGGVKLDAGSAKQLPPTVTLQYFPMDGASKFQPYVGVGVNYTKFFDEDVDSELENALGLTGGDLELDDSWGWAAQAGFDYAIDEHWLLNASVWYIDLQTDAKFKFDQPVVIEADVDVDPWVYMIGIGYKF
ncbi:MAG TPA: outer membrane protein OmpW [Porticoccus sp.]|nr:outer membrane protein OmpW [Porticoccus sp.]